MPSNDEIYRTSLSDASCVDLDGIINASFTSKEVRQSMRASVRRPTEELSTFVVPEEYKFNELYPSFKEELFQAWIHSMLHLSAFDCSNCTNEHAISFLELIARFKAKTLQVLAVSERMTFNGDILQQFPNLKIIYFCNPESGDVVYKLNCHS